VGAPDPKREWFHLLSYTVLPGVAPAITEISRQSAALFGRTPEQILRDPEAFPSLLHPDDREWVLKEHAQAAVVARPLVWEYRLLATGPTTRWVHDEAVPVEDQAGISRLRGHCLDITVRKGSEQQLHEREEHFQAVVANIPGVVYRCACDKKWTMFFMSDYMETLVGYPASDFIGNRVRTYGSIIHPDDRPFVVQEIDAALARGSAYALEYRLIRADGRARWIAEHGRAVLDDDGNPLWLDGVLFDITRQKVAEEARDRAEEELRHQALYDQLTGLPNRTLLHDRTRQAIADARREKTQLAVLMLDLDHFKKVNDTWGHAAGDGVLTEVGHRLERALREQDSIARWGGDEFAVLIRKTSLPDLLQVVDRIRRAVDSPIDLDGQPVTVGVSVGIARFPDDGDDVATLLRRADVAMYAAKESHSGYALYDGSRDFHAPVPPPSPEASGTGRSGSSGEAA
jgi:diguanylate cyclase (GGDEF)-like protein/PAS domain S-box-containing protein